MKIVKPSIELITTTPYEEALRIVELSGRNCYNSFGKIQDGSAERFIKSIIKSGHDSVLEHFSITYAVTCSRDVMAQWTRHRISSFSIRSQRYNNYKDGITVIKPEGISEDTMDYGCWKASCENSEKDYKFLISLGSKPEVARSVLPNSTATVMYVTMNMREIRTFLTLRMDSHAQSDIRNLATDLYKLIEKNYPVFVEGID